MEYRRLGQAGSKVSQLSLGSWVTFGSQMDVKKAQELLHYAYDNGMNFFDNAEVYAQGKSEEIMGQIFKNLQIPRLKYIVSTKFFWGITDGPNERNTLNRKYLMNAITGSLKRLQMDYVDLVYCHRPDPNTPMEEIVWSMHDMIERGHALYWGTSEWSAADIDEAFRVADRLNLRKPVVEQPQYNLLFRQKVEKEFQPIYEKYKIGLTTWSPLASGVLTGKYLNGTPEGSRLSMPNFSWLKEEIITPSNTQKVKQFVELAKSVDVPPASLAIAWCTQNPHVSSVITGATSIDQLKTVFKSLEVLPQIDATLRQKLDRI